MDAMRATPASLEFRDVSMSYLTGDPFLLHANLRIGAGATAAVVCGSPRSRVTLIQVLRGRCAPSTGAILVGTQSLASLPPSEITRRVRVVPAVPSVLPGSIGENITLGMNSTSPGDFLFASRATGIEDLIIALPDGYRTEVSDDPADLPMAIRMRIPVTRAVLSGAGVLVVEVPTEPAERREQRIALRRAFSGCTIVYVAGSIRDVDGPEPIFQLQRRAFVECGSQRPRTRPSQRVDCRRDTTRLDRAGSSWR